MTIQDVHDGLKVRLDTVTDLVTFSYQPARAVYPCAFPLLPSVDYHQAFARGLSEVSVDVVLLVASIEEETRTSNLLAYLDPTGSQSIPAAIEGDTTLGGAASDVIVRQFRPFGMDDIAAMQAIGGVFPVSVYLT